MSRRAAPSSTPVLSPELAARVGALTLRARRVVEGLLSGAHRSPHRGASVVFVEHRDYRPGDDLRKLDWRAYARTDRHVIKRFEQESQLRAMLVLDRSGSMAFRGPGAARDKAEHAATLLSALAYVLIGQGDAAGAALVSDALDDVLPPRSRAAQLDAVLTALSEPPAPGRPTDLRAALTSVAERAGRRGVVAVASDLLDLESDALDPLGQLVARGNDVLVLHVLSPAELELPFEGPTRFVGLEQEPATEADADGVREAYVAEVRAFLDSCQRRCVAVGARYVLARTDEPPERTLATLLTAAGRRGW